MIIRCNRVDRYLFEAYYHSSRVAQEWIIEARNKAPWMEEELLADFFMAFYLPQPELDQTQSAPPFHRWMVQTLLRQYFYRSIHPRTTGQESAAFKTAIKALMWLTKTYTEEVKKKEAEESAPMLGQQQKQGIEGQDQASMVERLTEKQVERLKLIGYTLQQGKRIVEEKQEASDARPLVEKEIEALRTRIEEMQEEMKGNFQKRSKLLQKVKKLEEELGQKEKQHDRLVKQEREAIASIEEELGQWLDRSLKESLGDEDEDARFLHELLQASQRFANRKWGTELGKLRRQTFEQYLKWVDKLKRHPELVSYLEEIGRNVHHFRIKRKELRSRQSPEEYYDLRISGDISHLLPSEAVLLADPDLENYFLMKWVEQKLLTYDTAGWIEEPPKGPVICALDTSHSMRGSKLRLAQLFVMTFAALSLLEKRNFTLLLFGARGEWKEQALYWRKPDWTSFYNLAQQAFGGGTHFDVPIRRAIEIIDSQQAFRGADIVMVTDGIGGISAPVQQQLGEAARRTNIKMHSLIIGSARQHLVQKYDILGVSHTVRFATTWETQEETNTGLLLDVLQ